MAISSKSLLDGRSRVALAALLIGLAAACSSSGDPENAARDKCETTAGVGQCVERSGRWVAVGSRNGTTSTTSAGASTPSSSAASTTAPASTAPSTTLPVTVPASGSGLGDARSLPAGLFCRDLIRRGFSYSAAVEYWRLHGNTNQMDADRNGIPCETVFPRSDVAAFWGSQTPTAPAGGLPSGLYCKDLYAANITYPLAVAYWYYVGAPARMDADGNGIPCETVYPASTINSYWFG